MLESEREAKKLIGPDTGSWSGRSRMRKAYRQMELTPEEESPRHKKRGRGKKHVHEYDLEGTLLRVEKGWRGWREVRQHTCRTCGNRRTSY